MTEVFRHPQTLLIGDPGVAFDSGFVGALKRKKTPGFRL
jgi:hypothetical protein